MARPRLRAADLPRITQMRIPVLIEQSAPDLERPRGSEAMEKRLSEIERKSAACYAALEDSTVRLSELAEQLTEKSAVKHKKKNKGDSDG